MSLWELEVIAVGLSMDAFAIAICKGLSVEKVEKTHLISAGLWFGGAQAIMPLLGFLLGSGFQALIESFDHWISFALLLLIGINMIREASGETEVLDASFSAKAMFPLAIADSIDAFAAGVTFAFREVKIIPAALLIGVTTFVFSAWGVKIGNKFGERYKAKAEFAGGLILILMGFFMLVEDLSVL